MTPLLIEEYQKFSDLFEAESRNYFDNQMHSTTDESLKDFIESLKYTYFLEAKRFRPFLIFLSAQFFKKDFLSIIRFAMAIECIHTYSLIHDDLPSMDNDDYRRGQLSNHKVYGEASALLAGDVLQSLAFELISSIEDCPSNSIVKSINYFSKKIGLFGMVGGQVLDIKQIDQPTLNQITNIHYLKTGCLIESALVGSAMLLGANEIEIENLKSYGRNLGLAFQIKDDLLDKDEKEQSLKNYVHLLGSEKTENELLKISNLAISALAGYSFHPFIELVDYNLKRNK